MISDARVIEQYYLETYGKRSHCIAYGAEAERVQSREVLDRLGLEPGGYFLYVSRMEPENNALLTVRAFERTSLKQKLVMVGDAPYAAEYIQRGEERERPLTMFFSRRHLRPGLPRAPVALLRLRPRH